MSTEIRYITRARPARWLAAAVLLAPATVLAQGAGAPPGGQAEMPDLNADLTAYRVDSEVFGWNKKFTEVAALGSEVRRGKRGEHRGEMFLLVFDIGSLIAKHNVHVLHITQAALPHDPIALEDARERMWAIDVVYQNKWPRRPKRKHFRGAMTIEPIWESVDLGDGICQPTVGFMLSYKGTRRYQPHHQIPDIKAPCDHLRMKDQRIYWAKKDLGAVMIRFDYSTTDNEISLRFPLSASWNLARPVKITLRAPDPAKKAGVRKTLSVYGSVKKERGGGSGAGWQVVFRGRELIYLAHRIAGQIGGRVVDGDPPAGADILVMAATTQTIPKRTSDPSAPEYSPVGDLPDYGSSYQCSGLLRDCE